MAVIRVGVAGWDYPDWNGIVYPARARGLDRLAYLARFVDMVEVNSSFYRPLDPGLSASWVRRTASHPDFRFSAKAHRDVTHVGESEPAAVAPETLEGLRPLHEAGVLGAVLLQFPQRFHRTPETLDRLARLLDAFQGWPVVVEVRHVSWDRDEAADAFRERAVGWCVVDQPRVGPSTAGPTPRVTSPVAYLRLHGRNAANWFREGAGRDARYDYLYPETELRPLADAANQMSSQAEEVFVVQNNHFRGQALVNALQMKHLLNHPKPPAPGPLIRTYPELADSVTTDQPTLF